MQVALLILVTKVKMIFQTASELYGGRLKILLCYVTIGLKVTLVYATKILGKYDVEAMMAKSANSTESRPGIAQITIMQGGLGLMMSTLMITAPLLVGNLIGSSLGFNTYNPLQGGNSPTNADGSPRVNQKKHRSDNTQSEKV